MLATISTQINWFDSSIGSVCQVLTANSVIQANHDMVKVCMFRLVC